jgi:hypothetical protein
VTAVGFCGDAVLCAVGPNVTCYSAASGAVLCESRVRRIKHEKKKKEEKKKEEKQRRERGGERERERERISN